MDNLANDYTYLCSAVIHPMPSLTSKPPTVKLAPRYMAKRPLLTIKIPTAIEKEPLSKEVSCFSPITPDIEDSESEATLESPNGSAHGEQDRDEDENEDEEARQQEERHDIVRPMVRLGAGRGCHRRHGSFQANACPAKRMPQWRRRLSIATVSPVSPLSLSPSSYCSTSPSNASDCTMCCRTPTLSDIIRRRRPSPHCDRPLNNAGDCIATRKTPSLSASDTFRRRILNPFDGTSHRRVPSGLDIMSHSRSPKTFTFPSYHRGPKTLDGHAWRSTTC